MNFHNHGVIPPPQYVAPPSQHYPNVDLVPGMRLPPQQRLNTQKPQKSCKNRLLLFSSYLLSVSIVSFLGIVNQYHFYSMQQLTAFFTQLPKRRTADLDSAASELFSGLFDASVFSDFFNGHCAIACSYTAGAAC